MRGQELAHARIWGSIEEIPERHKRTIGAVLRVSEYPELQSVAPTTGEFEFAGFKITRRKIDELDNCTIKRI